MADEHLAREEAERVAGPHSQRAEPVAAAPRERDLGQPLAPAVPARMPTTRPGRLDGSVDSFQSSIHGFAEPVVVLDPVDRLEHLADVGPRVEDPVVGADAVQAAAVEPRSDPSAAVR